MFIFQEYGIFWPVEGEDLDCEQFKIKFVEITEHANYITRDFTLQSLQDDYELSARIIQCSNWPHKCLPVISLFELINLVQEWHIEYQNGPIVVVDRYAFYFEKFVLIKY